ncbi:MAG: NAD-dependent epimerase/dehydratase family protein [Rhodobacteraceae bacterium]|nr:NAD-dependent epimerase/dehydratase family protein [Paracoccaceae bacterium]
MSAPTLLISGGSGAIGQAFVAVAGKRWPGARLICLVRSEKAAETIRCAAGPQTRIEPLIADLTDPVSMATAGSHLGQLGSVLGVHAAADVSWERSADEMADLNVNGSLLFLELLRQVSDAPRLVYLSTAYTQVEDWTYRNGYEITKANAERRIAQEARDIPVSTFACSLVVGDSRNGQIGRYNGIYPILKFLADYAPPFLVGKRSAKLDIVPVDWVCSELAVLCEEQFEQAPARNVIAASGVDTRISFERIVRIGEDQIAKFDSKLGLPRAQAVPVVKSRQWAFLKRCLHAWEPPEVTLSDFRYFERLLQVYGTYAENDKVRDPVGISCAAPDPENFLPIVVDRWLEDHAPRLEKRRRKIHRVQVDG